MHIKGTEVLCSVASEEEVIQYCGALVQLYREQARYLERIYKWAARVGVDVVRAQIVDDPDRRMALLERFIYSQQFSQSDPWAERVRGRDAHEFKPLAELSLEDVA
jgi:nitrite reductase (NADH) large subunit